MCIRISYINSIIIIGGITYSFGIEDIQDYAIHRFLGACLLKGICLVLSTWAVYPLPVLIHSPLPTASYGKYRRNVCFPSKTIVKCCSRICT